MCKMRRIVLLVSLVVALLASACKPIPPPEPTSTVQDVVPAPTESRAANAEVVTGTVTAAEVEAVADPAADRLLQEGIQYHEAGDYEKAIATFTEAIELNPTLTGAYTHRAASHLRLGDNESAIADSDEAIRLDAKNADAYLYRGVAQCYEGLFEACAQDLTKSILLNPTSVDAHVYRGAAYFFLEEYAAVARDCTLSLHLSGGYFLPIELCLNVISELIAPEFEKVEAAMEDYNTAIRLNPDAAGVYFLRGLTYRAHGEMEAAIQDLKDALRLDPLLGDPLLMYWTFAYEDSADPAADIAQLEIALALVEPDSVLERLVQSSLENLRAKQQ